MACSSQEPLRHMRRFAYRCFLPDLTGFTSSHCAGPNLHRRPYRPAPKMDGRMKGINPAIADCGLQGTATSPFSTAKLFTDQIFAKMAEGVGFEPTRRLPVYTLSRRAPSAARTSLRVLERSSMAEGVGFEPTRRVNAYSLSRRARSTAPTPLREASIFP
jgi:hypothetical protein